MNAPAAGPPARRARPGPVQRGHRERQNRAGSLSPPSRPSHATGRPLPRAQPASSAVLPDPAGAHTSTRPLASPSPSARTRRRRGTKPGCGRGTCSLVASRTSCPDVATPAGAAIGRSAIGDLPPRPVGLSRGGVPLSVIWCLHAARRRLRAVNHRQAIGHKQITRARLTEPRPLPLQRAVISVVQAVPPRDAARLVYPAPITARSHSPATFGRRPALRPLLPSTDEGNNGSEPELVPEPDNEQTWRKT